jgi:integrase
VKARGTGSVFRRVYRDKKTGTLKETDTWWVRYYYRGEKKTESSGSTKRSAATKLLKKRLAEMGSGRAPGVDVEKTTYAQLAEMLVNDYRANGRKSLVRVERSVKHLSGFFAEYRAIDVTTDRVLAYIAHRQDEKAMNATINRELAALKRMLRLGARAGKVAGVPSISLLREDNVRKGFFERPQLDAVMRHLSEDLWPLALVAYITGWRVKSEILSRQWQHVEFRAGWLRLDPGETKNRKGRNFPLTPELRQVLESQRARTQALEQSTGRIIPWVFHRDGKPIIDFRGSWKNACKKAGLPGRIPHDFRRTAVRNLERAGVPRSDAKAMVGHLTDSIYNRYAISDEASLKESAEKLSRLHESEKRFERKVSGN